jgi:hypothetical protein
VVLSGLDKWKWNGMTFLDHRADAIKGI